MRMALTLRPFRGSKIFLGVAFLISLKIFLGLRLAAAVQGTTARVAPGVGQTCVMICKSLLKKQCTGKRVSCTMCATKRVLPARVPARPAVGVRCVQIARVRGRFGVVQVFSLLRKVVRAVVVRGRLSKVPVHGVQVVALSVKSKKLSSVFRQV